MLPHRTNQGSGQLKFYSKKDLTPLKEKKDEEKICIYNIFILGVAFLILALPVQARIKLVALPERGKTNIRLDNPQATLIEEERVLTLQKGLNKVDLLLNSWIAY